jgi:hypothetical protein
MHIAEAYVYNLIIMFLYTDEIIEPLSEPYCEGIRCSLGQCIPWKKVCDGIRDCREGLDENPEQCQKMKERFESGVSEFSKLNLYYFLRK